MQKRESERVEANLTSYLEKSAGLKEAEKSCWKRNSCCEGAKLDNEPCAVLTSVGDISLGLASIGYESLVAGGKGMRWSTKKKRERRFDAFQRSDPCCLFRVRRVANMI